MIILRRILFCLLGLAMWQYLAFAQAKSLRISLNTGPDHIRNIVADIFIKDLERNAKGAFNIKLYPSAQLFKASEIPKALHEGDIDMGIPGIPYLSTLVPNAAVYSLPMFFGRNSGEVHKISDGAIGRLLNRNIEELLDVKVLGLNLDLGHTSTFTTSDRIEKIEDLKGLRIRVPQSPGARVRFKAMGAEILSVPLNDLARSLERHNIDGLSTTHETVRSLRLWQSGVRYAFNIQDSFVQYVPLVSRKFWDSLPPELQVTLTSSWRHAVLEGRRLAVVRQLEAKREGAANGILNVPPDKEDLAYFRRLLLSIQNQMVSVLGMDKAFVDRVDKALNF
ncbi:MAG: TRAP transporter substrate-binding protein DctP [Pseudomonadota bacterium]